jgi:hypothetical protein
MPFAARDDETRDEFAVADEHPGGSRLLLAAQKLLTPCLVSLKISSFFTLSITSIFNRLHGVLNVGKK